MAATEAPRLYLVTPPNAAERVDAVARATERILATGAVACLRIGVEADDAALTTVANALLPIAHAAEVPLLATDRPALVQPLGLDGVHLTADGGRLGALRKALGPDTILGAFAGASRHRAMSLAEAGADYVALGPAAEAGELLAWWAEVIEVPSVAEGGVGPGTAAELGGVADFLVPGPEIWEADDPAATLAPYLEALTR